MRHVFPPRNTRTARIETLTGGLDLSLPPERVAPGKLTACRNMWRERGALRTRPGLCLTDAVDGEQGALRIGAGEYRRDGKTGRLFVESHTAGEQTVRRWGVVWEDGTVQAQSTALDAADVHLLCDIGGERVMAFTDEGVAILGGEGGEAYIPTVRINGAGVENTDSVPATAGVLWEEFNLLTSAWRETFTTDGTARYFFLLRRGVEAAITVRYTGAQGVTVTHSLGAGQLIENTERGDGLRLTYQKELGAVGLIGYPNAELRPGAAGFSGNLTVTVRPAEQADGRILGMTRSVWYGGDNSGLAGGTRLFLTGNPACPHLVHWSAVSDPTYFPENNYLYVGVADSGVVAFGRQSDRLILFKPHEIYALRYRSGEGPSAEEVAAGVSPGTEVSAAGFTLAPVHASVGCGAPESVCLCAGRLVFLSAEGAVCRLIGLSAWSETNVQTLSEPIAPQLRLYSNTVRQKACACEYHGRYLLYIGDEIWVLDGGDENYSALSQRAAWYRWDTPGELPAAALCGGGQAACVTAGGSDGYHRRVYLLGGESDSVYDAAAGAYAAVPVPGMFETGLLAGPTPRRRQLCRVQLHCEGRVPSVSCRSEWESRALPPGRRGADGCVCFAPGAGEGTRFGMTVRADAPFAVYDVRIRYRETGWNK
ncbi:MAG: hypothetical protein IKI50_05225 [Clostridia bacterium]|nr:hypothetical protein [Clostridia bacterium]